ncbi:hypothetical protein HAX54_032209 [Datura stramonium]|uniref:Uncharacterized protein n=1 Tax=Datura stramonium TaxID=4076 RepID=A0ABS8RL98_DATST|nr:hypothetical protein [Datura stramonium]
MMLLTFSTNSGYQIGNQHQDLKLMSFTGYVVVVICLGFAIWDLYPYFTVLLWLPIASPMFSQMVLRCTNSFALTTYHIDVSPLTGHVSHHRGGARPRTSLRDSCQTAYTGWRMRGIG